MRRTMYISRLDQIYTYAYYSVWCFFMIYIYNTYIILFCNIYGCFSFIHENNTQRDIFRGTLSLHENSHVGRFPPRVARNAKSRKVENIDFGI